jgi:hypothetical protein
MHDHDNSIASHEERLAQYFGTMTEPWSSVENIAPGIYVYHDVLPQAMNLIGRLESVLSNPGSHFQWQEALVGYAQKMPEYRDCVDFKYRKTDIAGDLSNYSTTLQGVWQDSYDQMLNCVKHYSKLHNIGELRYWEAMNFVKYGPGKHFQEHHDHGYSYNCTVSLVAYPNDDYEGGELVFRSWDLTYKPKAGDVVIFPSNYMYPHTAKMVESGFKYSIVTMLDFSAKYHRPEMYNETDD